MNDIDKKQFRNGIMTSMTPTIYPMGGVCVVVGVGGRRHRRRRRALAGSANTRSSDLARNRNAIVNSTIRKEIFARITAAMNKPAK